MSTRSPRGFGDEPTLRWLAEAELHITRALLFSVVDQAGETDAWKVLADVEPRSPAAVELVLGHPYVRVWAVDQLRAEPTHRADRLGCLAAAAAIHAGVTAELDLMVHGGVLQLPTAGAIDWPDGDGPVRLVTGPAGSA